MARRGVNHLGSVWALIALLSIIAEGVWPGAAAKLSFGFADFRQVPTLPSRLQMDREEGNVVRLALSTGLPGPALKRIE